MQSLPTLLLSLIPSKRNLRNTKINAGSSSSVWKETIGHYYETDDLSLIKRIRKYRDNYFLWITDFNIPTTNNISERNLRPAKVKQKVSGQYIAITSARYFARIRSYLQTCRIYNVAETEALSRLTAGITLRVKMLGEIYGGLIILFSHKIHLYESVM